MTTVPFNYATFILRYPEFQTVQEPLACLYFGETALYCANDDCALIPADPTTYQPRLSILNAITAHIAAINAGVSGQAASPLVGRISDASEGSVNVKTALDNVPGSAAWWTQTKYGLSAWQMMAQYRTARYVPSFGRFAQGVYNRGYGYGRGFGGFR